MSSEGTIRRRRRAAPNPIGEGERKNVTFLASSEIYNLLVEASERSGRSISECLEMHLSRNLTEDVKPNFENVFFGSPESLDIIRQISLIFAAHDAPNRGSKWTKDSNTSAAIFGAVVAILHKSMPLISAEDANFEAAYASGLKTGALISEVMKGKMPST